MQINIILNSKGCVSHRRLGCSYIVQARGGRGACDLQHLSCYKLHDLKIVKTFDRTLDAAANAG
ncbi:MAG: hypothetical protein ABFS45_08960 [Pseudomonadota bacterium]